MDERFGTWLRQAMADIDDERLKKRWAAIEELTGDLDHSEIGHLIRLSAQVGEADQEIVSKLRAAFFKHDSAFDMSGNDLELRLLSGALVITMLGDKTQDPLDHALSVVCLSFGGAHSGFELLDLVSEANKVLDGLSREKRPNTPLASPQKRAITAATILKPLKVQADAGQPHAMIAEVEPILAEYAKSFNQLATDNARLRTAFELQKEEVNMLWWLMGAHSNDLAIPYSDLPKAAAAVVAGKEFAQLVSHRPGPIGASGIIKRMLANGSGKLQKVSLQNLVTKLPLGWRTELAKSTVDFTSRFCPLLTAIETSVRLKDDDAWIKVFEGNFPHAVNTAIAPEVLGFQMYREWMMALEVATWE